jgi:hypothetical protein
VEAAEPLVEREQVRQRLARVLADREPIDDRDRRALRELHHDLVGAGPGHDAVHEPRQVARHVADGLASAEHHALGQVDRMPAQLRHPRLERHPRPEAVLLEQHRQRPPLQRRTCAAREEFALSSVAAEQHPVLRRQVGSRDRSRRGVTVAASGRSASLGGRAKPPPVVEAKAQVSTRAAHSGA